MVVLILENVPVGLRGELSRWMIEPRAGVFVGSMSGMVRDKLWEKVKEEVKEGKGDGESGGGATLLHTSNNEQGFLVRTHGQTRREMVEFEGLWLVRRPAVEREEGRGASRGRRRGRAAKAGESGPES